jgi:hypothetical protein
MTILVPSPFEERVRVRFVSFTFLKNAETSSA